MCKGLRIGISVVQRSTNQHDMHHHRESLRTYRFEELRIALIPWPSCLGGIFSQRFSEERQMHCFSVASRRLLFVEKQSLLSCPTAQDLNAEPFVEGIAVKHMSGSVLELLYEV